MFTFKMDEKTVRKTLLEFILFINDPGHSKVVCFKDVAIPYYHSNGTKIGKRILMMN